MCCSKSRWYISNDFPRGLLYRYEVCLAVSFLGQVYNILAMVLSKCFDIITKCCVLLVFSLLGV